MQKNDIDSNEFAGAKSETPNHAFALSLESRVESDKKVYRITISHFLECTCPDFLNMAVASIEKWG
jgi:hypothetical protein